MQHPHARLPGFNPPSLALALLSCAAFTLHGCNRAPLETPTEKAAASEQTKPTALPSQGERHPVHSRLIALGDLHGDLAATRAALRLGRAIDASDRWIGGDLIVVQTGDQIDKGDDEPEILALFQRLAFEAEAAGGAVHSLIGNHELMNLASNFQFVTDEGFRDYTTKPDTETVDREGRTQAFKPGGEVALLLATRDVFAIVGDSIFVHGGLLPEHLEYGLARINNEVRDWARGEGAAPMHILQGRGSPALTRIHSKGSPYPETCSQLEQVLTAAGVKRLVVGHTVQEQGINTVCDEMVWRIDVGMARHYGGPIEVLEISPTGVTVLRESRD